VLQNISSTRSKFGVPKSGAQRHSMKLGIRILLHRSRLQQELRATYRADSVLP
jgi:hypothetical protein